MTKRAPPKQFEAKGLVSMTGFGAGTAANGGVRIEVEVKTANSRFLDLSVKAPRLYSGIEGEIREVVSATVQRGRVEVLVSRVEQKNAARKIAFHQDVFAATFAVYKRVLGETGCDSPEARLAAVRDILSRHEVLGVGEGEVVSAREKKMVLEASRHAVRELQEMRRREGARLVSDLVGRLGRLEKVHGAIERRANGAPDTVRQRLHARIERLAPAIQVDPARLAAEVALIAERVDITEELVRLSSHFEQFRGALTTPGGGKKLDFLLQEFGREFNTIGSKAQDAPVQAAVVEAKTEMEKMREQVQNLE